MLDDFRRQASVDFFEEPVEEVPPPQEEIIVHHTFLGLTPVQRFMLSLMLLATTTMVGSLLLLVTGRVALPIF